MSRYIAAMRSGDREAGYRFFAEDNLEIRRANVYRVQGEQISEIWIFEADQYAVDALFGE